ncbi:hypothetical protein [Flavilitoribacter nigricans]|uniref:Uncharacterized protein n=1 Tax=Flavilitoribacter nigricans (strain ATCC 23147 / DSM 23189 / NBRC 102662 / NCIMB 1420 / SS-2) TaxID=1122177 RepID=A0A2D0N4X9_FLAN2|nr:hypothetical protein [Flavilitoribacter nigricans]PHN03448.1 hypothetical protein CRP01_27595 [Flavilitoribacter nigricans DSM 23189 = NBRC 102662]
MPQTYERERVMLICWKWRDFELKQRIVSNALLKEKPYKKVLKDIEAFRDILFDEFTVCDELPDETTPAVVPRAVIVRTYVTHELNNLECKSYAYIKALIDLYKTDGNDLYVFLHRRDHFGDQEVGDILTQTAADKCFLIGEGRDQIYYRDFRNQGLLGDNGKFYRSPINPNKPPVTVANHKTKKVFQPHFDKIWEYYHHEFHTKIFELKEDLLVYFYKMYPDDKPWDSDRMKAELEEDECLRLRLASFIDHDTYQLSNDEINRLKAFGIQVEKSYEFDDCRKNLVENYHLGAEYERIANFLTHLFFTGSNGNEGSVNTVLREIVAGFSQLLESIKQQESDSISTGS